MDKRFSEENDKLMPEKQNLIADHESKRHITRLPCNERGRPRTSGHARSVKPAVVLPPIRSPKTPKPPSTTKPLHNDTKIFRRQLLTPKSPQTNTSKSVTQVTSDCALPDVASPMRRCHPRTLQIIEQHRRNNPAVIAQPPSPPKPPPQTNISKSVTQVKSDCALPEVALPIRKRHPRTLKIIEQHRRNNPVILPQPPSSPKPQHPIINHRSHATLKSTARNNLPKLSCVKTNIDESSSGFIPRPPTKPKNAKTTTGYAEASTKPRRNGVTLATLPSARVNMIREQNIEGFETRPPTPRPQINNKCATKPLTLPSVSRKPLPPISTLANEALQSAVALPKVVNFCFRSRESGSDFKALSF